LDAPSDGSVALVAPGDDALPAWEGSVGTMRDPIEALGSVPLPVAYLYGLGLRARRGFRTLNT